MISKHENILQLKLSHTQKSKYLKQETKNITGDKLIEE